MLIILLFAVCGMPAAASDHAPGARSGAQLPGNDVVGGDPAFRHGSDVADAAIAAEPAHGNGAAPRLGTNADRSYALNAPLALGGGLLAGVSAITLTGFRRRTRLVLIASVIVFAILG